MHAVGHVVALAPKDEVAAIRDDLARLGFVAETREPDAGTYEVVDTSFREHVSRLRNGLLMGAMVGAAVGVLVVVASPTLRDTSLTLRFLVVLAIALQGTIPVMMWRMSRVENFDDAAVRLRQASPDDTLIVVDDEHREGRIRHVLEQHHVTFVVDEHPVRRTE